MQCYTNHQVQAFEWNNKFLVFDQIGKATEETAAEFTFKDCVHLFEENVFQLCSTCK